MTSEKNFQRGKILEMISWKKKSNSAFNITYPTFQNVRNTMEELHIVLTPDKEHKVLRNTMEELHIVLTRDKEHKVLHNVHVVGF